MKIKHNKKRNIGLVFEQLNQLLTESIIRSDKDTASVCLRLMREHFRSGTELAKELRLFLSLSTIQVKDSALIERIMREAKEASKNVDRKKLAKEKTELIKQVNEQFGKSQVFNTKVQNFKSLATVQVLLNEWRKKESASYVVELEEKLINEIKNSNALEVKKKTSPPVNQLVLEMARKKFNQKYSNLSQNQVNMLFEYVTTADHDKLIKKYEQLRMRVLSESEAYLKSDKENHSKYFKEKLQEAIEKIRRFNFSDSEVIMEHKVERAVTLQKLAEDLENE